MTERVRDITPGSVTFLPDGVGHLPENQNRCCGTCLEESEYLHRKASAQCDAGEITPAQASVIYKRCKKPQKLVFKGQIVGGFIWACPVCDYKLTRTRR